MMEAARTSEALVNFYQTTRRYNPEDSHLITALFLNHWSEIRRLIAPLLPRLTNSISRYGIFYYSCKILLFCVSGSLYVFFSFDGLNTQNILHIVSLGKAVKINFFPLYTDMKFNVTLIIV
jgi:hypothetical protein